MGKRHRIDAAWKPALGFMSAVRAYRIDQHSFGIRHGPHVARMVAHPLTIMIERIPGLP
jgi:hypothetical protein